MIGAVALFLLFFVLSPSNFNEWITYEFLSKAVTIFFVLPIAYAIVKGTLPKEIIVVLGVGGISYVVYAIVLSLTFKEGLLIVLQTLVEIVLIAGVMEYSQRLLEKHIPP